MSSLVRAYCITLPETPERTEKAKEHFKVRGVKVEFFEGIHAEKFGLNTVHTYDVDNPGTNFRIGFKPTGIWLSHYMLWAALKMRYEADRYCDTFMVLEIDAKFPADWVARLKTALDVLPSDWDMLYIGSCCCKGQPTIPIRDPVYEVHWPVCTHAYMVRGKALATMLRTQRKVYAPIDISLTFHSHPELRVYTVLPRIVDQFDTEITP